MICNRCGKDLPDNVNFCDECGNDMRYVQGNPQDYTRSSDQSYEQGYYNQYRSNGYNQGYNQFNMPPYQNISTRSRTAAGVLGILLGAFGVHNFYLGFYGRAVAQLLITVLSCGMLCIVSVVWGLIEGIMILTGSINTDADGKFLAN